MSTFETPNHPSTVGDPIRWTRIALSVAEAYVAFPIAAAELKRVLYRIGRSTNRQYKLAERGVVFGLQPAFSSNLNQKDIVESGIFDIEWAAVQQLNDWPQMQQTDFDEILLYLWELTYPREELPDLHPRCLAFFDEDYKNCPPVHLESYAFRNLPLICRHLDRDLQERVLKDHPSGYCLPDKVTKAKKPKNGEKEPGSVGPKSSVKDKEPQVQPSAQGRRPRRKPTRAPAILAPPSPKEANHDPISSQHDHLGPLNQQLPPTMPFHLPVPETLHQLPPGEIDRRRARLAVNRTRRGSQVHLAGRDYSVATGSSEAPSRHLTQTNPLPHSGEHNAEPPSNGFLPHYFPEESHEQKLSSQPYQTLLPPLSTTTGIPMVGESLPSVNDILHGPPRAPVTEERPLWDNQNELSSHFVPRRRRENERARARAFLRDTYL